MTRPRKLKTSSDYQRSAAELQVHCAVVELLEVAAHPLLIWFHVPNGEARSPRTGAKLKRMGVLPGVADLALTLPDGRSAFLEIKADYGKLSEAQIDFTVRCFHANAPYAIAHSVDEAQDILSRWGALRMTVQARAA